MTDEEFKELAGDLDELRTETREALAEELSGDPDDYRLDGEPVSDGGE